MDLFKKISISKEKVDELNKKKDAEITETKIVSERIVSEIRSSTEDTVYGLKKATEVASSLLESGDVEGVLAMADKMMLSVEQSQEDHIRAGVEKGAMKAATDASSRKI